MNKQLMTVTEVIEVTGLGRTTINRLMNSKELPSVKVGARRLVPVNGLEAWLRDLSEGTRTPEASNA